MNMSDSCNVVCMHLTHIYFPHFELIISKNTIHFENRIENEFIYRLLSIQIVHLNSIENRKQLAITDSKHNNSFM